MEGWQFFDEKKVILRKTKPSNDLVLYHKICSEMYENHQITESFIMNLELKNKKLQYLLN